MRLARLRRREAFGFGLLGLSAVLLAGCTRFHSKPLSPATTAAELEGRSLTNDALKAFLERNLQHPLDPWPMRVWDLDALTLVAFYYSPSLEVARAEWRVVTAGEVTAAERPNPTVTASGVYEPAAGAFSPWIPGVVFDLPIETAGKRRLRKEQARHQSEAARFSLATAAWQARSQVRSGVSELVAARKRRELVQAQLEMRQELVKRQESQLETGAISRFELNTARLALVRARADLADAERLLAEARPKLADALGVPTRALEDGEPEFAVNTAEAAEDMTSSQARELALRGRADILGALADYAASQSALQLEVARQYPDVHLSPGYSWNAGSTGEHDWQVGATVELPLLSQHQGAVAEASARRDASAARFLALQAKVINEIDSAVASFRATQTNAAALETMLTAQTGQQRSVEEQFRAGALDRLELLNAGIELNAAALAHLDAQVRLEQAAGSLEDAVQRPFPAWRVAETGASAQKERP